MSEGGDRQFLSLAPALTRIQTLAKHCGIEPVVNHPFAALIPSLGLHHVVLDAEFLESAVQVEPERSSQAILCTGCGVVPLT